MKSVPLGRRVSAVAASTCWTARSNAASVFADVDCTPLTLRTYWRAAASLSSPVAAGSPAPGLVVVLPQPGQPTRGPW